MDLKKIIEYIPRDIKDFALKESVKNTKYVGWLDFCDGELFVRVYAFRNTKSYGFQLREVIRENIDDLIARDMYWTGCAGWKVVYKPERKSSSNWYGYTYYSIQEEDFGVWAYEGKVGVCYTILNLERLYDGKYKYCGYQHGNLFEYLRAYEDNPQVEFFGKIGMKPSKSLVNKCKKDKGFAHFLWQNKDDYYTPKALIYAYDHHVDCKTAQDLISEKARSVHYYKHFESILRNKNVDKLKVYRYCRRNHIQPWSYNDYLKAIDYLGLDFADTKNLFPKDFRRMHDLRANQYESKKAEDNKKLQAELNKTFHQRNKDYKVLEYSKDAYCVLIPNFIKDLKNEGSKLHHCVGKMGYDAKVAKGESIIAFVRNIDSKNKPFVTVEYSIKKGRVIQCYGDHDSNPDKEVKDFVKEWEEFVHKNLKTKVV